MTEQECSAEGCQKRTDKERKIHGMQIQGIPIEVYLCGDHEEQLWNSQKETA